MKSDVLSKWKFGAFLLMSGVLVPTVSTFATGLDTEGNEDNQSASSKVQIEVEAPVVTEESTDPIFPIDPENPVDPEKPVDPDAGGGTGNKGALRIDWVSPLEFGSHELSSSMHIYNLASRDRDPFVQVSDLRGTGVGWTLQVQGSQFTDGTNSLKGAELKLPTGEVKTDSVNAENKPLTDEVIVNESPSTVMTASEGQGMGTWAAVFPKGDVQLMVPAGNYVGDYQATLTWTLLDAPE